jgi:hypothetical protein
VMTEQPAQRAPKTWVDVCVEGACSATNTSLSASRWTVAHVDRRVANGATVQVRVAEGRDLTARLGETWTGTMRPGVQGPVPCSLPGCDHSSADERVWLSRPTSTTASRPRPGP